MHSLFVKRKIQINSCEIIALIIIFDLFFSFTKYYYEVFSKFSLGIVSKCTYLILLTLC